MELNIRVKALMDWFFGFDLKRASEVAVRVAEEMDAMIPGADWDHMDGTIFVDHARTALHKIMEEDPYLFI